VVNVIDNIENVEVEIAHRNTDLLGLRDPFLEEVLA